MNALPVSVIIPCRNGLAALPAHVAQLREWMADAAQVVVVDSSEDGSLAYLRREITHPNVEFHTVPPGLYAAWNFGVSRATAEFVYFATIGDAASAVGIRRLSEVALSHSADVVISPPEVVGIDRQPLREHVWPIHRFFAEFGGSAPFLPSANERFLLCTAFLPETILGSSASNLYRREVLSRLPLPVDFGRFGDAAWAVRHGASLRIALVPEPCAPFVVHASAHMDQSPEAEVAATRRLLAEARTTARGLSAETGGAFWPAWMAVAEAQQEKRALGNQLKAAERAELVREKSALLAEKNQLLETKNKSLETLRDNLRTLNVELARRAERLTQLARRVGELEGPWKLNARVLDAVARLRRKKL